MQTDYTQLAKDKLKLLTANFATTLDDEDEEFMKNLQSKNLAGDDPKLYRYWEWTQGVGLYGLWKMYSKLHDKEALDILLSYYKRQIGIGFPAKNINTTAPLLALSFVYEYDKENKAFYENLMDEWAYYLMTGLPKTEEGGFLLLIRLITANFGMIRFLWRYCFLQTEEKQRETKSGLRRRSISFSCTPVI